MAITSTCVAVTPDQAEIERAVTALAAQLSDGRAVNYPEYRSIQFGPLLGGPARDAVAFFSMEGFFNGGNTHAEYLAVFAAVAKNDSVSERKLPAFRLLAISRIGGRGWRSFDWKTATLHRNGTLSVEGWKWRAQDSMCCPTLPVSSTFRVTNGNLQEVR